MKKQEERFRLTEQAVMQNALNEFGIQVSIPMARGILRQFMDNMMRQGYIEKSEDKKDERSELPS